MMSPRAGRGETLIVLLLLLLFPVQAGLSAWQKSLTIDEYTHMGAGASYVEYNDYTLNPNHPPFCKVISALAFMPLKPIVPEVPQGDVRKAQRYYGIRFARRNAPDIERITFAGRLPHICIAVLLGLAIWLSVRHLLGRLAGVVALALWATDPNVLAHARLIHTDSGASVFVFLSVVLLVLVVLRRPTWPGCFLFSLFFALALLTKFSTVVLVLVIPLQIALYAVAVRWSWLEPSAYSGGALSPGMLRRAVLRLTVASALTTLLLALLLYRGQIRWWVYGLSCVMEHDETGHIAFVLGRWFESGQWYYFVVALAVKTPVPLLGLALLGGVMTLRGLRERRGFDQFVLVLPGIIWLAFAMSSGINLGIRHVLPAYVFLFILAGAGAERLSRSRWSLVILAVLLCWQAIGAVRTYPDYIPYFNEPAGGPEAGIRYFADSNNDWGQELLTLRSYMRENDETRVAVYSLAAPAPDIYDLQTIGRLASAPARDNPALLALGMRDYAKIMFMKDAKYETSREFLRRQDMVEHLRNTIYIYRVTEPFPTPFP